MPYDQLPTMNELVGPAIDGLISELSEPKRTAVMLHANNGVYADVIRGWKAQGEKVRRREMQEIKASRIGFARGAALTELARSEFLIADLPNGPSSAVGEIVLQRTRTTDSPSVSFPGGEIKRGSRFRRAAAPSYVVPLGEAIYEASGTVVVGQAATQPPSLNTDGKWVHTQTVTVPVKAARDGDHANAPFVANQDLPPAPLITDRLFDTTFAAVSVRAAGGSTGMTDDDIEALAGATVLGSRGPNDAAALAGALYYPGVRHVAGGLDAATAFLSLYAADKSWASSPQLSAAVLQYLSDFPWLGFGCRARLRPVDVYAVIARPTVTLRARQYLDDTTEIAGNILKALTAYFDSRPDWWTWKTATAKAAIIASDRRILDCTSFTLTVPGTGATIGEPEPIQPGAPTALPHWQLVNEGVDISFGGPS